MSANPKEPTDRTGHRYDAQGRRLCTARRRGTDQLCNAPAVTGHDVCRIHGASSPQAQNKARIRLLQLVDPAIAVLAQELDGKIPGDRMKAANSILDRAGIGRVTKIEGPDARELLYERLLELRAQTVNDDPDTWVIEGHIIESGENTMSPDDHPIDPCPECQQGKHDACNGTTWDNTLDEPTTCPCNDAAHADA